MALNLRLITPEGIHWQGECQMVVLPGAMGDVGILENHAHSIIQMKPGVVRIYGRDVGQISQKFFLKGGVINITDKCDVLCEEVFFLEDMDIGALKNQVKDLREKLSDTKDFHEIHILQDHIQLMDTQIKALEVS